MKSGFGSKLERYVFIKGFIAFIVAVILLTAIVWVTQVLNRLDLVTTQGQTLKLFLIISSLALPSLLVVLSPIALLLAVVFVLRTLHTESELVIISASGGSPKRLVRPIFWLAFCVALFTGYLSIYLAPMGLKILSEQKTNIRADIINSILVPGTFADIEKGMLVHIKERNDDGSLSGILIKDTRDPILSSSYLAKRGALVETGVNAYLILQDGSIVRQEENSGSTNIIEFESYAFDLSALKEKVSTVRVRSKELPILELLSGATKDENQTLRREHFAEAHLRIIAPLYSFAFAMIALLYLASPQTTRTGQFTAIILAIISVVVLRSVGFALENEIEGTNLVVPVLYALPLGATLFCVIAMWLNLRLDFPQRLAEGIFTFFGNFFTSPNTTPGNKQNV